MFIRDRLGAPARARLLLVRGTLERLPLGRRPRFAFAVSAFHSVQHLHRDADLVRFFRAVRAALRPGGWFAFDLFAPDARLLARAPGQRWGRTRFRHPITRRPLVYTVSQRFDRRRRTLAMTFHYQPVDARGRPRGRERRVLLEHRLLAPDEVARLLARAGLALIARWGGFDGRPLAPDNSDGEQHIYLAQRPANQRRMRAPARSASSRNRPKKGRKPRILRR
jgi:SAM-dependent methyltransferase